MSARFKIRRHPVDGAMHSPWTLKDRRRPAWLGQYTSHDRAIAAMDNIMRTDLGVGLRLSITHREIREAMTS